MHDARRTWFKRVLSAGVLVLAALGMFRPTVLQSADVTQNYLNYHDWILIEFCAGDCNTASCCVVL